MCNFFLLNKIQVTLNLRHSFAKTEKKKERMLKKKSECHAHQEYGAQNNSHLWGLLNIKQALSYCTAEEMDIFFLLCVCVSASMCVSVCVCYLM